MLLELWRRREVVVYLLSPRGWPVFYLRQECKHILLGSVDLHFGVVHEGPRYHRGHLGGCRVPRGGRLSTSLDSHALGTEYVPKPSVLV